jgi:alpha-L-rhamnosidase
MKKTLLLSGLVLLTAIATAQLTIDHLQCENLVNPLGLDLQHPRFSWQLNSDKRNVRQTAYEIIAGEAPALNNIAVTWRSGKIASSQSVHIPYNGTALQAGKRYYWKVRVWDQEGKASAWSQPAWWETGLLQPANWKAKWITPGYVEDSIMRPSPLFRKQFAIRKKIKSARLYITSQGLYRAFINDKMVGDSYLTPGWTSYKHRLQYQTYDVTSQLSQGNNAIGVMLGSGWFRGYLAWANNHDYYGKTLALLAQVVITYADGQTETLLTDESWRSATGAIRYSEIYNGEINDARLDKTGWLTAGYDDKDWSSVATPTISKDNIITTYNEPVKKHETFKPIKIFRTPQGDLVADFGQNLVGLVTVKVSGKAGDSVYIQHAEILDKQGNFYTENLRDAKQENIYVLKGNGEESFEPVFTFQGFRYIRVKGFPGELKPEHLTATALYSDMPLTGSFSTSHPLINQLQHNIEWGQKGNFLDVPTDCPQRDERLGWTGDAQVFARTASFNRQVYNFFAKWMADLAADQLKDGRVPAVIPDVLRGDAAGSAGWSDAATIIPWQLYLAYGDTAILRQQYVSMKAWVDFMQQASKDYLWNTTWHFGDWLFYRPNDDNDGRSAITDKHLIAQCFFANSLQMLINAARVLGKEEDQKTYTPVLEKVKQAFLKEYLTPNGRLVSSSQTAYVLALHFDMLPDNLRAQAANRLVQNIKDYGYHLTTGFLGTPYLCHVLTRFGHNDIAYRLLLQESYPSWLYPVKMGATTIWERWDGQKPDGSFQTPTMNSFNHYAYGAIGDWMYRVAAGIDTDTAGPGYRHIRIKPYPHHGLTEVNARLQTAYGAVSSHWTVQDNYLILEVEIPVNTSAAIYIPATNGTAITEGNIPLDQVKELTVAGQEGGYVVVQAGSGKYRFVTNLPPSYSTP